MIPCNHKELLNEFLDEQVAADMRQERINSLVEDAMRPGGSHDPYGYYEYRYWAGNEKRSWLNEATGQQDEGWWLELSALLRGGFNDEAAKMMSDVARAYAESCARQEFERDFD